MAARHRKGEVVAATSELLRSRNGGPASVADVRKAIQGRLDQEVEDHTHAPPICRSTVL